MDYFVGFTFDGSEPEIMRTTKVSALDPEGAVRCAAGFLVSQGMWKHSHYAWARVWDDKDRPIGDYGADARMTVQVTVTGRHNGGPVFASQKST